MWWNVSGATLKGESDRSRHQFLISGADPGGDCGHRGGSRILKRGGGGGVLPLDV